MAGRGTSLRWAAGGFVLGIVSRARMPMAHAFSYSIGSADAIPDAIPDSVSDFRTECIRIPP